jgi:hypothetical protein
MKDKELLVLGALGVGAYLFIIKPTQETGKFFQELDTLPVKIGNQYIENLSGGVKNTAEQIGVLSENLVKSIANLTNENKDLTKDIIDLQNAITCLQNPLQCAATNIGANIGTNIAQNLLNQNQAPNLNTPAPVQTPTATIKQGTISGSIQYNPSAGFYVNTGSQSVPISSGIGSTSGTLGKTTLISQPTTTKVSTGVTTSTFMGQTSYTTSDGRTFMSASTAQQEQAKIK